mmetsp:Transcript_20281/g.27923  ORF Transcript_20281/g.27923 Transcript_20281/m.27923 type:complete len:97 (+) Transcript_20281:7-297(+)
MAFRATKIFRMSERYDVHPALKKLWKKHYQVDGMVTQHLSPFEQNIVTPMFKDAPLKIAKKLKEYTFEAGAGLSLGVFVFFWGDYEHKNIAYHHRN